MTKERWIVRGFKTKEAKEASWSDKVRTKAIALKKMAMLDKQGYARVELARVSPITGIALGDMDGYKKRRKKRK